MSPRIELEFKENSQYQEGTISKIYQRPDKSHFQERKDLENLVNMASLVHKFLLKQADIDQILKIIHQNTQGYTLTYDNKRNTGRISSQLIL